MDANPYAPPTAVVEDVEVPQYAPGTPLFFAVGRAKFLLMSLCTMGLYELYWFYQNWKIIRSRDGANFSPGVRAFFAVFYVYKLIDRIRQQDPTSRAGSLSAGGLATGWIVLTLVARLPAPYWLLTYFAPLFLLPVQAAVNELNRQAAPQAEENTRLTGWNWAALVLGGLFFILVLIGALVPRA